MEQNIISETLTAVNVFLKDGRRLCGLLLNNVNSTTEQDAWKFVSNWNLPEFEKTHSSQYVETFTTDMIHHIDPYLK